MLQADKILKNTLKFLKKLTIVDYLIIIIVLLGVIILYKFFNPEQKWIDAVVLDNNIPIFQANSLKVGDIEKDPNGNKIASIEKLETFDTPNTQASNKDVFITLKLLVRVNPRSKEYEYKNKIIKVGAPIELRFNSGLVNGNISELENISRNMVIKTLTLKLYEQWPWFGDSIKVGSGEKDQNGEFLVQVLDKEVTPAQIVVNDASGNPLLKTDPQKVDITLKVKVQANLINNQIIFGRDKRIIVGELFSFNSGDTRIKDTNIIKIGS